MTSLLPYILSVNGGRDWASGNPSAQSRHCRLETAQWALRALADLEELEP
jgi:hypothetical protein